MTTAPIEIRQQAYRLTFGANVRREGVLILDLHAVIGETQRNSHHFVQSDSRIARNGCRIARIFVGARRV